MCSSTRKSDKHSVRIFVKNPMKHNTWDDGQYTSYAILLETSNVAFKYPKTLVRRRYSEFVKLKKLLKEQHATIDPPSLPSKSFFSNKFCPKFIGQRRKGLEDFLEKVLHVQLYLSNRTLHLFLQSNLPMDEIENITWGHQKKHIKSEPHLILCPYPALDTDFDVTDPINESHHDHYCNISFGEHDTSTEYGSHDSHSHVTLGSRISICSPTLEVPETVDETDNCESAIINVGSLDSDYSSTAGTSSPTSGKSPMSHGILHFRTHSQNSSTTGSPVRKKKVSFHSEVTVAHLLTN